MTTGWVWHESYAWHDTGTSAGFVPTGPTVQPHGHVESAESKARFASLVEVSGLADHLHRLRVEPASERDLARVHTPDHLDRMRRQSEQPKGGDMGDGTSPFGPGGFEIARRSAGGTIAAFEAVVNGAVDNAYALVRPPGHHALPASGMGFCMFANIAIAIQRMRADHGIGRVAVVDWDVHHGNGTEAIFNEDPTVLTCSLHQDGNFPSSTGAVDDRGTGEGAGSALNVPLPPGSGHGAYEYAFDEVVMPALRRFRPDLIVVASGFDASNADPLAAMMLTSTGYRAFTERLLDAADELCGGRLVMSHEGGYSAAYVPYCGLAVMEALSGVRTGVVDPFERHWIDLPGQPLQPHQRDLIDRVSAHVADIPTPG